MLIYAVDVTEKTVFKRVIGRLLRASILTEM